MDQLRDIVMNMSVNSSEVASILVRFQDVLLNHGAISSANVDVTKKVLTSLLQRLRIVETDLGDLDELPPDCDSVIAAIVSFEDKLNRRVTLITGVLLRLLMCWVMGLLWFPLVWIFIIHQIMFLAVSNIS